MTKMLKIGYFEGKGRGIIAGKVFKEGELIEQAPVIVIPPEECEFLEKTVLGNHYFAWGEDDIYGAFVLGYGALYNHSYNPNAVYVKNFSSLTVDFIALRNITENEEITVNYNRDPNDKSPVWFDVV